MLKFLSIVGVAGALSAARVANASAATQDQGRWVLSSAGSTVKGHVVTFSVALHPKAGSQAEVARLLDAVSSPDSPQYGQYLGPEQVRVLTATPDAVVDRVATELLPAVCHNTAGSALLCTATAAVAERVLGTTLAQYTHTRTGGTTVKVAVGSGLASRIANYIKLSRIYYLNPNKCKNMDSRCVLLSGPSIKGAGNKTRLNQASKTRSRIQHKRMFSHVLFIIAFFRHCQQQSETTSRSSVG